MDPLRARIAALEAENAALRRAAQAAGDAAPGGDGTPALGPHAGFDRIRHHAPVALFALDRGSRFLSANEHLAEITGLPAVDHAGRTVDEVVPGLAGRLRELFRPVLERGEAVLGAEVRGETPGATGGERRWLANFAPLRSENGAVAGLVGAMLEIAGRGGAEAALREGEARQSHLLALAEELRELSDPAAMAEAAARLLGRRLGAAQAAFGEVDEAGERVTVLRDWSDGRVPSAAGTWRLDGFGPEIVAALEAGATAAVPDVRRDPRTAPPPVAAAYARAGVRAMLAVPLVRGGRVAALLFVRHPGPRPWTADEVATAEGTCQRLWAAVERARAEETLRESEARFRALAEATPALLFETDAAGRNTYVNGRFERYAGLSGAELMGDGWLRVLHPDDRARAAETWAAAVESGGPYEIEYRFRGRDGAYRWFLGRGAPLLDAEGAIQRWVGTCTDIHNAKQAVELLDRHRAELERLVEERTAALMRSVEEHRRAEDAARQAEKLAALGQLTGGVAHDFNNILQVVTSGAALLQRPAMAEARRTAILDGMIQAGQKARDLTGRLLAFARRQPLKPEAFDVAGRLAGLSELLRQTLGPRIAVATDVVPGLWPAHADPSQFEVALLNLAVNARDAMPEGGTLTIQARNVALSASAERAAGEYVCIAAKDTGQGIPPHLLGRIFEPFFTTKSAGTGTGLGLSQVHGFVTQSGGDIHVESEPGRGTAVFFHLPRAAAAEAAGAAPPDAGGPAARSPAVGAPDPGRVSVLQGVGKTVLVVDDTPDVAALACSFLEELGYATESAADGPAALAVLEGGARVDAVFSDVVMPGGMSGVELAAALRSSHPGIAVVLATGYSEALAQGGAPEGVETLRKPYRVEELAAALDRALARSGAPAEAAR